MFSYGKRNIYREIYIEKEKKKKVNSISMSYIPVRDGHQFPSIKDSFKKLSSLIDKFFKLFFSANKILFFKFCLYKKFYKKRIQELKNRYTYSLL